MLPLHSLLQCGIEQVIISVPFMLADDAKKIILDSDIFYCFLFLFADTFSFFVELKL